MSIDDMAERMRSDAIWEIKQAMRDVPLDDLTSLEVLSMMTLMRQVRTRIEADEAEPARVLTLVKRERKKLSGIG